VNADDAIKNGVADGVMFEWGSIPLLSHRPLARCCHAGRAFDGASGVP